MIKYLKRKKLLDCLLEEASLGQDLSAKKLNLFLQNAKDDLRDFFFSKLENPHWLKPLSKNGELKFPEALKGKDGKSLESNTWPEGIYLSKIAKEKPTEVFEIIKPYLENNLDKNIGVGHFVLMGIFKISENFPEEKIYSLNVGKSYLNYLRHGQNLDAMVNSYYVKDFLKDLARRGYEDLVLQIAQELLAMKATESENAKFHDFKTRFSDNANMEDYYYEEILKVIQNSVLSKNSFKLFETLCQILKKAVDESFSKESNQRLCFNRSAIEDHEQDKFRNAAEFKLISAIRDSAEYIFENDLKNVAKVIKILEGRLNGNLEFLIFTRIILHLLRKYSKNQSKLVIAKHLIVKERFNDHKIHHEYYNLLQQEFKNLSAINQKKIFGFITEGFEEKKNYKAPLNKGVSKEMDSYARRWMFDKLDCIRNGLRGKWKKKYEELSKEFEKAKHPDLTHFFESGLVIDQSPLTEKELAEKSLPEIIEFLISWKPEISLRSANPRGLGDAIEKDFGKNPKKYLDDLLLFKQVSSPTYIKRLIRAFAKYANKTESDWKVAIELGEWVANQSEETIKITEFDNYAFDGDVHWGWCKYEFARLISESCRSKDQNQVSIPKNLFKNVVLILEKMILDKDSILENWGDSDNDNDDRYYSRAINSCHGEALSALIEFALWLFRKNNHSSASKFLIPILDKLIIKNGYLEGWAVLGRYLPWIMLIDKDWVQKNLDKVFPENNRVKFDAAWLTYINFVPPFDEAFEMLRDKYLFALENPTNEEKDDNRSSFKFGESIAAFYFRGKIDLDDNLLTKLFEKRPKDGNAMISLIGRWCCNENNLPPKDIVDRFKKLWDWRVKSSKTKSISIKEYESFKWWYKSGLFDRKWAIEQFLESVKEAGEDKRPEIFIIGERLFEDLQQYPEVAWETMKLILQVNGYFMDVDINFVKQAFELIEKSDWSKIKKEASEVKDDFCRKNKLDAEFMSIYR